MDRAHFGDQEFYAAFGAQELSDPIQTCPSGNTVGWMCHSGVCEASVYCGQNSCLCCRDNHAYCGSRTRRIGITTNQLNQLLLKKRELIERIRITDTEFVSNLTQKQRDMVQSSPFDDLRKESQEIVQLLYKKPQQKKFSGKQSQMFMDDISALNKHYDILVPQLINWYTREMQKLTAEAIRIKERVLKALDPQENKQKKSFVIDVSKLQREIEAAPIPAIKEQKVQRTFLERRQVQKQIQRQLERKRLRELERQKERQIDAEERERIIINERGQTDILFDQAKQLTVVKKNQEAIRVYRKLLEIDPNNLKAHNNLGVLYSFYKRYNDTLDCFDKAINIDPQNMTAYKNIQILFKSIKESKLIKRASQLMEKVLKNNKNNEVALETLQFLKQKSSTK